MQSTTSSFPFLAPVSATTAGFGSRLSACLLQPLAYFRRENPMKRQRVANLAETVASQPVLRHWLLTVASEPPRVRRALLARGAQAMRSELGDCTAADALMQLADERTLHAVTEALFHRGGMQPPPQRTGRSARVRLAELGERLAAHDRAPLAA